MPVRRDSFANCKLRSDRDSLGPPIADVVFSTLRKGNKHQPFISRQSPSSPNKARLDNACFETRSGNVFFFSLIFFLRPQFSLFPSYSSWRRKPETFTNFPTPGEEEKTKAIVTIYYRRCRLLRLQAPRLQTLIIRKR